MKSIELFAGAGGLALGLEKAGFEAVALIENNKWASQTLEKNRPSWNVVSKDIEEVTKSGIKKYLNSDFEIDLLSGGYPCQTFSYAGNRLGLEDTRGTLFYHYAEILKEIRPKMFLAENVKGLVSHDKGRTLKTMIQVFEDVGYKIQYKVLNSVNFGVAQKRERIFIVGIRDDFYKGEFQFPEPLKEKLVLKDVLKDVPESPCGTYSQKKKDVLELVPAGGCWRDLPDEVAKDYMGKSYFLGGGKTGMARKLSWDEPSLTVLCSPSQKQTERCHPDEIRPFSIRENARIQSFPDDWEFVGSISEQYRQIGNAVPVKLAKHMGLAIKKYLENGGEKKNGQLQFEIY
jgi:DNA (cytosine-5)-methyltransferase 1